MMKLSSFVVDLTMDVLENLMNICATNVFKIIPIKLMNRANRAAGSDHLRYSRGSLTHP
jgi:hypothetical protein